MICHLHLLCTQLECRSFHLDTLKLSVTVNGWSEYLPTLHTCAKLTHKIAAAAAAAAAAVAAAAKISARRRHEKKNRDFYQNFENEKIAKKV